MPRRKRSICHHKTFTTLSHPADKFRRHWRQIGGMTKRTRRNRRAADAGRAYPRVAGRSADILVGLFVWPRRGSLGTRRQECQRFARSLATRECALLRSRGFSGLANRGTPLLGPLPLEQRHWAPSLRYVTAVAVRGSQAGWRALERFVTWRGSIYPPGSGRRRTGRLTRSWGHSRLPPGPRFQPA